MNRKAYQKKESKNAKLPVAGVRATKMCAVAI